MPAIETACRYQKAVLWAANGSDDYGEYKVDAAVEIDVRWETLQKEGGGRNSATTPQGNPVALDSQVIVDRAIPVGSIMWLGKLVDLPSPPTNLRHVVSYEETPDVKGRNFNRVVSLVKHSDDLPVLA